MFRRSKIRNDTLELLTLGMNRFQVKLNRHLIDTLSFDFHKHQRDQNTEIRSQLRSIPRHARANWLKDVGVSLDERRTSRGEVLRALFDFLMSDVAELLETLASLRRRNAEFRNAISVLTSPQQRDEILLAYAQELAPTRGDRAALRRFLNDEAINDRFIRIVGETEQRVAFTMERLGHLAADILQRVGESAEGDPASAQRSFWQRTRLESVCQSVLVYEGDPRVNVSALKCLSRAILGTPPQVADSLLTDSSCDFLRSACLDRTLDVWVQCEAFTVFSMIQPSKVASLIRNRLSNPGDRDDMFVRRHAVGLLGRSFVKGVSRAGGGESLANLLRLAARDRSAFVRQQVVVAAVSASPDVATPILEELCLHDPCEKVRASTLVGMLEHADQPMLMNRLMEFVHRILKEEHDEFVVRTALFVACRWIETNGQPEGLNGDFFRQVIVPDMLAIESDEERSVPMRRWSAQARERVWMLLDPAARQLYDCLASRARSVVPGRSTSIPRKWLGKLDSDFVGRVLAVLAQDDFGYDLERTLIGYRLVRGPVFRFRFWRFWYELMNRAPDKRQAFQHTIGRWSEATIRAPSQIMGELSQTKVPGEPYFVATDGSWRPFLPLVDDFISALQLNWFVRRPVRFYSSQGVTEVFAPRSWVRMVRAIWKLNFGFPRLAQLRNWDDDPQNEPTAYLQEIKSLGFTVQHRSHSLAGNVVPTSTRASLSHDSSVLRFFPLVAPVGLLPIGGIMPDFVMPDFEQLAREYTRYFGSAYENSLHHLVIFVTLFLAFFVVKHWLSNMAVRRARRAIPISIGGWGTRGKSGTERLKAALIGAMGYGLVSKTTGCEAMFIQAHAFGEPLEIPLFRPYDKATIWEQADILKLASKLKPAVFLWECMGLTPAYVEVLSRQWTCDDLATITNTYPDHEDLQGPAGYDVATTISGFVPRKSHVITTEEEMRPLVAESCRRVGSSLRGVGWLESGLITDDVQDRFPYKEHPNNIALVSAMGDELGVTYEYSVKAMADFLVPDLGVLKVYPVAHVRGRKIEFTNGMSANERFGCMGNWTRLGFDKPHPHTEPDTWVTAVINNRADRVARSRVFASIMVHDIEVDRFFVIGNNLSGLQGFIAEAWAEREKQLKLCSDSGRWNRDEAIAALEEAARELRQPTTPEHVQASLRAMFCSCVDDVHAEQLLENWRSPDTVRDSLRSSRAEESTLNAIQTHHAELLRALDEFESLREVIASSSTNSDSLELRFRDQMRTWFMRRLVVIENYEATGEEVVATIVDETPPGFLNRTMGMQNIKGTGLDFIYRFQAWDACYNACQQLKGDNLRVAEKGLQSLAAMPVIGQLCGEELTSTIAASRAASHLQRSDIQSELTNLEKKLSGTDGNPASPSAKGADGSRLKTAKQMVLDVFEQFIDANDAISRRRHCDHVYRELRQGRISRQAAVEELRVTNKRQKGGWLKGK